ncbi:YciI family protein [Arenimonas aestuarii]
MLYAIHCLDHSDALSRRLANYEAHKAYLVNAAVNTVISGPLLGADAETMIGSLFIVEAADIAEARNFNESDPFHRAGVWSRVDIRAFQMRVDNRTRGA